MFLTLMDKFYILLKLEKINAIIKLITTVQYLFIFISIIDICVCNIICKDFI